MKKKWLGKLILAFLMSLIAASVALIGVFYFVFISDQIHKDSSDHLWEIYDQVSRSLDMFIDRNWGLLGSWDDTLVNMQEEQIPDFFKEQQEHWSISQFYFLSVDKTCMDSDGNSCTLTLEDEWHEVFEDKHSIMVGDKSPLEQNQKITVFAAPSRHGTYRGFEYDAIAVSYLNSVITEILDVDSFAGKARSFVIHSDGRVLLSTQTGSGGFANYLTYLQGQNLDDTNLQKIRSDLVGKTPGLIQCDLGRETPVSYYLLYQPVDLADQDYSILSAVPQSAVSAGFLSIQSTTINVLILIFFLIGAAVIFLVILRSRNQSRKNKMELQYRELMFDVLSNTVDDIFIMIDPETQRVDYLSPNVERLLGIPGSAVREDIRTMAKCAVDFNIIVPKTELDEIPLGGNKSWECEYMHQSTGERRWYRVTIYRMVIQDVAKNIIVMSDRTLDKQLNQKLQEALDAAKSANEAKSNFLSNMSHDIRTPMNAIVGFSVLLEKDADQVEKVREYTRKIMASSHHLLSLINDVLDMSKIESGKTSLNVEKFSLPELLDELNIILLPQAKAKNQEFVIRVDGAPPEEILGDKLRLNQILINLLSNAIKYTQLGGNINFLIEKLSQDENRYVKLRFTVKDNGIGMSEEFQKHIFAPFSREINSVTNKIQGTGLGMAITKNLVDLMGGVIGVESAPGKGSTFTLEMSFALPTEEEKDDWFRQKVTRMLVCDDEEQICLNICEMMHDTGVDVSYVTEGEKAVSSAVRAHEHGEDFHVILLDWKMPGMDGVETARRIRAKVGAAVPILVLTSYDWSEIEDEAKKAGINAFLPKPFFTSTFWQTIKPLFTAETPLQYRAAPEETEKERVMEGKTFLVAEDNELNAEILTSMLDLEGAKCDVVVNGKEAVEQLLQADPEKYDMILMDVQMPVMNGYEATEAIRASDHPRAKTIPIVAMTANTFAEDVQNALNAGMDGHLAKPIDMNAVRETVGKLLKKEIRQSHPEKKGETS